MEMPSIMLPSSDLMPRQSRTNEAEARPAHVQPASAHMCTWTQRLIRNGRDEDRGLAPCNHRCKGLETN